MLILNLHYIYVRKQSLHELTYTQFTLRLRKLSLYTCTQTKLMKKENGGETRKSFLIILKI
jgi:hypothetical protein